MEKQENAIKKYLKSFSRFPFFASIHDERIKEEITSRRFISVQGIKQNKQTSTPNQPGSPGVWNFYWFFGALRGFN